MTGPWLTAEDKAAVQAVLDSGDLMSGRLVSMLERELAIWFLRKHAVCVSSGTAALECAFVATGEGDRLHNHGFIAAVSAARAVGLEPKWREDESVGCDVLGVEYPVCAPVHDAAHRFDRDACRADVTCFSMNANKFIAAGGGVLLTDDADVARAARLHRNHGRDGGPEIVGKGRNLRMGEMNAALALSQMARMDEILAMRRRVAEWYDQLTGQSLAYTRASWFMYPLYKPGHGHRSMADFRLFDTATRADYDTALLPIWPTMTHGDCESVCK